jgi:O-antigen/teichoic acid export membrane protein
MMFLYTDIFIIKLLSDNSNIDIANYSFALNIGNMLLLIPLTLVQVDIEKLKNNFGYVRELNKKIIILVIIASVVLFLFFYIITNYYITDYKNIFLLFMIILSAKIVQSFSPIYGSMLIIFKKYNTNLYINLITLLMNVILSYLLYNSFSLYGIAIASVISLMVRQTLLYNSYIKSIK